jgi:hypothetical protein
MNWNSYIYIYIYMYIYWLMLFGEIMFVYSGKLYKKSWVSYGKCFILKTLSFNGCNRVPGGLPWHDAHTSTNMSRGADGGFSKIGKEPSHERHNAGYHQVTSICEHRSVFVVFRRKIPWCLKPNFHNIRTCSTFWSCRRSLGYRHTDAVKNSYFSGVGWSVLQLAHLQAFS